MRTLAAAARASIGTVHNTLAQLTDAGLLLDSQLHHSGRLLDAWAESYRRLAVRPLSPRALYATDDRWSGTVRAAGQGDVLLGGIAAAAVLDDQVRATDGIVYAASLGSAVTLLRLTTDPTPFRIEVRERFWGEALPTSQPGLVPSVLIYGDLLREETRARFRSQPTSGRTMRTFASLADAGGPIVDVPSYRQSATPGRRQDGALTSFPGAAHPIFGCSPS